MLLRDLQRILNIRDYCLDIQDTGKRFGASWETFYNDRVYQQAVAFSILQIGELATGLSEQYRNDTKGLMPWQLIRGVRNIIVHDYGKIQLDKVWEIVITDIPVLKDFCNSQLPTEYRQDD